MIVVADTGPINYLILIDEIKVLPALYERLLIPTAVYEELKNPRAPEAVRAFISQPPFWLEMRTASTANDLSLDHLDAGESSVIVLAEELNADQVILDKARGRREARRRHLALAGTLRVLRAGGQKGLLDIRSALARLQQTSFYVSQTILDQFLTKT